MPGHLGEADLARLCELGAEVASRIRAEIEEEDRLDADVFDESAELRLDRAGLSEVGGRRSPRAFGRRSTVIGGSPSASPPSGFTALMWATIVGGNRRRPRRGRRPSRRRPDPRHAARPARLPAGADGLRLAATGGARRRSSRVGLEAFARGYARSRGLEVEDRWRFHAAHRELAVPGFADHVFAGELPETGGLHGRFLMLGDAAELRTLGQEMAYICRPAPRLERAARRGRP